MSTVIFRQKATARPSQNSCVRTSSLAKLRLKAAPPWKAWSSSLPSSPRITSHLHMRKTPKLKNKSEARVLFKNETEAFDRFESQTWRLLFTTRQIRKPNICDSYLHHVRHQVNFPEMNTVDSDSGNARIVSSNYRLRAGSNSCSPWRQTRKRIYVGWSNRWESVHTWHLTCENNVCSHVCG